MSSEKYSESFPKDFEKTTEVLPFTKYGVSTLEQFQNEEKDLQHIEWLRNAGLSSEEIKLYSDNTGQVDPQRKLEASVLRSKLDVVYDKVEKFKQKVKESSKLEEEQSTSSKPETIFDRLEKIHTVATTFYPPEHPINNLHEIENNLFGHLKDNTEILPINQRRKLLRRLERRKERILNQNHPIPTTSISTKEPQPGSLWDVKEVTQKVDLHKTETSTSKDKLIGPKKQTMYTIKDGKIVRLEPVSNSNKVQEEFRAIDIVMPTNKAEGKLLEGTKMTVDHIRKMERFKDYEPGVPSKVLYIKNIAPSVSQEQLSILFNQFILDNGGPIGVTLLAGRMRGQAFISFQKEELAIRALDEVNGTILAGRPLIMQFGRQSNRIQDNT